MAYRTILSNVIGQPQTAPRTDGSLSELAAIFGRALGGAANLVNAAASETDQQNQDLAAIKKIELASIEARKELAIKGLRVESDLLQSAASINARQSQLSASIHTRQEQAAEEARDTTLKLQKRGLPQLLAMTPKDDLPKLIASNPHLLPEVQETIAEYVAKGVADEDAASLAASVAQNPTADIEALTDERLKQRLPLFGDSLTASVYKLKLEENKQTLMGKVILDLAEAERAKAIDGVAGEYSGGLAASLRSGTLTPDRFGQLLDRFSAGIARLDPKASKQDIQAAALQDIAELATGELGQSIGLSAAELLPQLQALAVARSDMPQIQGLVADLQADISKGQALAAKGLEDDLDSMIQGSLKSGMLDLIDSQIKNHVEAGRLATPAAIKLTGKLQERKQKLNLEDEAIKALGSDPLDPADNLSARMGTHHHEAIDRIADRLTLQGVPRALWQVKNYGFLTDSELNELRSQASAPDPRQFASAFAAFQAVSTVNPAYARSLADGKALPQKLETALHLSTFANEDAALVLSQLSQLSDSQIIAAREKILKPQKTGGSKNAAGQRLGDIQAIGEKLGASGVYDSKVQSTYLSAASMYAAMIAATQGVADDETLLTAADELATRFLKRNVAVRSLAGDEYLLFNKVAAHIGFDEGQYQNVDRVWRKERGRISRELGVSGSELRLNLNDAVRSGNKLVIPIQLQGMADFAIDRAGSLVTHLELPLDRIALKELADGPKSSPAALPSVAPMTPEQEQAIDRYSGRKGYGG